MRASRTISLVLVLMAAVSALNAQVSGLGEDPGATGGPLWLEAWSPLRPLADLAMIIPGSGMEALPLPPGSAHRVGLFWTGGNPAGLAREVEDVFGAMEVGSFRQSGEYRRPFDPGEKTSIRAAGFGWSPLGDSGAGIGRVVVDRSTIESPAFSNVLSPYSSSPLVVFDTLGDAKSWTAARVEGAGAWALGRLALGVSIGVDVQNRSTVAAPVSVPTRTSRPGATVGASWELLDDVLTMGAHARWRQSTHSLSVYSLSAASRVYELSGFDDPVAHNLVGTLIRRRVDGEARAVGGGAAGRVGGVQWALSGEVQSDEVFRYEGSAATSRKDRWKATGWSVAGALKGTLASTDFQLDVTGASVEGGLKLPDLNGEAFRSEEGRWSAFLDFRRAWHTWHGGLRLGLVRDAQTMRDRVVGAESDIRSWISTGLLEFGRSLSARWSASLGVGMTLYVPNGSLPDPLTLGPVYQEWIGPGLSFRGSKSTATFGSGRLSWSPGGDYSFFLIGSLSWLVPSVETVPLPGRPDGDRHDYRIRIGLQRAVAGGDT